MAVMTVLAGKATRVALATLLLAAPALALGGSPADPRTLVGGAGVVRSAAAPAPGGPDAGGGHAALLTGADGAPVRWDPCRAIPVAVQPDGGGIHGRSLVARAFADLSDATGLTFRLVGTTSEAPDVDRPSHRAGPDGAEWAPVLVAWSDPASYPPLGGDRVGVARPVAVDPPGRAPARYVTGSVVLDGDWFRAATATDTGRAQALAVLKHELGHLAGLDHVDDPSQLMNPVYRSLTDWSAGDRAGLALMGAGPCLDDHRP
ncbi:MAG: matrixin family metalloprotease [Kineosporiaceae bacterium]